MEIDWRRAQPTFQDDDDPYKISPCSRLLTTSFPRRWSSSYLKAVGRNRIEMKTEKPTEVEISLYIKNGLCEEVNAEGTSIVQNGKT